MTHIDAIEDIEDIGRCISVITEEQLEIIRLFLHISVEIQRECGLLHEHV